MATTVQTSVTDNQATSPFFYLRITGFPYYFFATVKPNDTRYGSFAWSTPTAYTAGTWAQQGLQLPADAIDQKFPDIIGGVATSGRMKLSVIDFPDPSHIGYKFFARLFAPGRALSDSSLAQAQLDNDIAPDIGLDSVIEVAGQTGTWTVPSDIYIGAETVGIDLDTPGGTGEHELQIAARNKYVCYGNSADGGSCWPPQPYHTVIRDAGGVVMSAASVTSEATDVLGRTAALWMGHMRPDGNPEPETSSTCLLLGRVVDVGIGKIGGMFDLTIESITADLTKGKIAPDLAHGTIQDGFYLQSAAWLTFYLSFAGEHTITIAAGTYATPQALANAINVQLATATAGTLTLVLEDSGDDTVFTFVSSATSSAGATIGVSGTPFSTVGAVAAEAARTSLHYALGFDPDLPKSTVTVESSTDAGSGPRLVSPRPVARVFVPCYNNSADVQLSEPDAALRFFTDPGDGTGQAWAKFSDGQLVKLNSSTPSTNIVGTGSAVGGMRGIAGALSGADLTASGLGRFYYAERGTTPTLDQVVLYVQASGGAGVGTFTRFLGRMLASTKGHTSASDGILNVYAQGVGMGWNVLLTAADWLQSDELGIQRFALIESATKWIDIFRPYAREHGLFLAWDPSANGISLRRLVVPQAASAGTNVTFSESNRARADDRTSQRVDRSSIRTSWKVKPAFSFKGDNGEGRTWILNDIRARSMYPNDDRQEEITDPTMVEGDAILRLLDKLRLTYSSPWTLCNRSMNKRGMLLCPGTIHKVIDNTMINPFTGASGIVTGDDVYCFLTRVSMEPAAGAVTIEFVVNSTDNGSLYRQWSPTGLVDFTMNTLGYTRGYASGTKTLFMVQHYSASATGDSFDFAAGDTVRIINRDSSSGTSSSQTDTIASTSTGTITLTTGISALSVLSETIVVLQKYNSAATTRKTGATKVAWQGNGDTKVIQTSSTARLNRWT